MERFCVEKLVTLALFRGDKMYDVKREYRRSEELCLQAHQKPLPNTAFEGN